MHYISALCLLEWQDAVWLRASRLRDRHSKTLTHNGGAPIANEWCGTARIVLEEGRVIVAARHLSAVRDITAFDASPSTIG
jgi:hypothetical protein